MIEIRHIAMLIAERALKKSNCSKRQVAFVLFDEQKNEIVDVSVNEHYETMPCQCVDGENDPFVVHAERVSLANNKTKGLSAVVTYSPCLRCAGEVVSAELKWLGIKEIKHPEGLHHIKAHSPNTTISTDWINDQQRIQAAWLVKNVFIQYESILQWLVSTR